MVAEIICVGTELLLGDILNTNAQFLSQRLADLGVSVYYQSVVGDNEERLINTIRLAQSRSDLILLSGGLGPTTDDLTKESVAKALDLKLYQDNQEAVKIKQFFKNRQIEMTENNLKQALIPEGAIILTNNNGTAPGVYIEKGGKNYAILPGPPNELIPMFNESVLPLIKQKTTDMIFSKTLRMVGVSESTAASILGDVIEKQTNPSIAPYAKLSEVHFRMTAKAESMEQAQNLIKDFEGVVFERLGQYIYTDQDQELEEVVIAKLAEKNLRIGTAESCTGGLFAASLVNSKGVSQVFHQGIIAYDNEVKINELQVSRDTIENFGAVSEQTAKEMALGIQKRSKANIGVSITGIAGPDGGTNEKPVGLVFIGIAIENEIHVYQVKLLGNRTKIRASAAKQALIYLYQLIR